MRTMLKMAAAGVLALSPFGGAALAQGMIASECKAEIAEFCAQTPHGAGAVPACLSQHADALTDACKAALASKGPGWGRTKRGPGEGMVIAQCEAEIARFCAEIPHGDGQVPACLREHLGELSDPCKITLATKGPGEGRGQDK